MPFPDDEAEVTETGVQKRARTQKEALSTLKQKTQDALKKGCLNPYSVVHFVDRTTTALEELKRDQPDNVSVSKLILGYTISTVRLVMKASCHPALIRFRHRPPLQFWLMEFMCVCCFITTPPLLPWASVVGSYIKKRWRRRQRWPRSHRRCS